MELVTVRTFNNYFSANIILTKLRDAGIPCYLKDEYMVTIDPFLTNAVGGIKLVINKKDLEEVSELLRLPEADQGGEAVCPKCGSADIELIPTHSTTNMIRAIQSWLFSDYAVSADNTYKCNNCGAESRPLRGSAEDSSLSGK